MLLASFLKKKMLSFWLSVSDYINDGWSMTYRDMKQRLIVVIISLFLISSFAYIVSTRNNDQVSQDTQQESSTVEEKTVDNSRINNTISEKFPPTRQNDTGLPSVYGKDNNETTDQSEDELIEEPDTIIMDTKIFSISPIDLENIEGIVPLGAMNPPGHVFPTDHIYFYITRTPGADHPHKVTMYSPGDLTITQIRASEHVLAEITDYTVTLGSEKYPDAVIWFGHVTSLDENLFGDTSEYSSWKLDSEYSTGGETYKMYSKDCMIEVKAGDIIGSAGGNPGQWALDLGVYDRQHLPEYVANMNRWGYSRYLNALNPLCCYEKGEVYSSIYALVEGTLGNTTYNMILQDVPGTAQGCWFLEGTTNTYSEDPHLALVRSNVDQNTRILSAGTSVQDLESNVYEFTPQDTGLINREFNDVTPDGNIYGYNIEGYRRTIIIKMHDNSTLWMEALKNNEDPGNWIFTENKTIFVR